jgi:hypothetical protein
MESKTVEPLNPGHFIQKLKAKGLEPEKINREPEQCDDCERKSSQPFALSPVLGI